MKVKGISSRENNLAKAVELSGKLLSRNIMWFRREKSMSANQRLENRECSHHDRSYMLCQSFEFLSYRIGSLQIYVFVIILAEVLRIV